MTYTRTGFLAALRQRDDLTDAAVRLALALDGYADDQGRCWPSQRRLADDTGWSLSKVKRTVRELSDAGLVTYVERACHRGQRSLIVLGTGVTPDTASAVDNPRTGVTPDTASPERTGVIPATGVTSDPEPVSPMNRTGVTGDTRNYPKNFPNEPPQGEGEPAGFVTRVLDDVPGPVGRAIRTAPADQRAQLRAVIVEAKAAGMTAGQFRQLHDAPTALDAPGVKRPAQAFAARIRDAIAKGAA